MFLSKGKLIFVSIGLKKSLLPNRSGLSLRLSQHVHASSQDRQNQNGTEASTANPDEKEIKPPPQSTEDHLKLIANLLTEKETLMETVKSLDDKYKRSIAETENVRRRMQRQLEETKVFAIQSFCKDLLEVADILQLAKDAVKQEALSEKSLAGNELKNLYEGVVMTESQLQKIFSKHGLIKCDPLGEKFNPNIHEALFEIVDDTKKVGTVGIVTKIGYLLHERPVRPAKVGIVKAAQA